MCCGVLTMEGSILLFTPVEKEKARSQLIRNSRAPYGFSSVAENLFGTHRALDSALQCPNPQSYSSVFSLVLLFFLFLRIFFLYVWMLYLHICMHTMCVQCHKRRALGPLQLDLQAIVSHLGTEPGSLQEQQVLTTEQPLQLHLGSFICLSSSQPGYFLLNISVKLR